MRNSRIGGILLILIGIIVLIQNLGIDVISWDFLRSFGFLLIGLFLLIKGFESKPRKNLYIGTFLTLLGFYFILSEINLYGINPGLSLTVLTFTAGISFYSLFIFTKHDWGYLLYGNLLLMIGFIFLLAYLHILPPYLLSETIDAYWPVLLILVGIIVVLRNFRLNK